MKKKILLPIICFALIFVFAVLASACELAGQKDHDHVYSEEWISDSVEHWRVCTVDGCTQISEKNRHDFEIEIIEQATCVQKGEELHTCKICGYKEKVETLFGEHSYKEYDRKEATCTQNGIIYKRCEICQDEKQTVLEPLGHDEVFVKGSEATCTEPGWNDYVYCSRCDYTTKEEIPVAKHDWIYYDATAPTCTSSGCDAYKVCRNCGETDYKELLPLGHLFVSVGAKQATCVEFGNTEYEHCERCGYDTPHESYDPTGHELEDHYCVKCTKSLYDSNLYGYEFLATMPQGEEMQDFYDMIAVAAFNFDRDTTSDYEEDAVLLSVSLSSIGLDFDQAGKVWKTFKDDYPIYYWMTNHIALIGDNVEIYVDNDYRLGATRAYCNQMIDEAVSELASMLYAGASAYDAALCYHDAIILAIDYAYDENDNPEDALWAHNIIGVLEKTGAVCEGYARTFQLLLNYSDVENLLVTGESQGVGHAWNLIMLDDGQWYWCDLTYDDAALRGYGYKHDYFCQIDEEFLKNHEFALSTGEGVDFLYDLPERSESEYEAGDLSLGSEFETENMKFKIVGYNEVSLLEYVCNDPDVVVPEYVTYDGRKMKIVSLGDDGICIVFVSSSDVQVRSVYIPATVRNIWDTALRTNTIENIVVSPDNNVYTSVDGILYTKDLYTLVKFPSASAMTSLVIPDETRYVADYAFERCANLSSVTIGPNVRTIGVTNWGYGYPTALQPFTNIISGDTGRMIDALAGEKEFLIDPANTRFVKDGAGVYNYSKTTLYYVYDWATEFEIPTTLTRIEEYGVNYMFYYCDDLEIFYMDQSNGYFGVDGGVLYMDNFTVLYAVPKMIKGHVTLHDGVVSVGNLKFFEREYVTGVTLPDSVVLIGTQAFKGCTSLTEIVISSKVEEIRYEAFAGCTSLASVTLNEGLLIIEARAFSGCTSLAEITVPASVQEIKSYVFDGCDSLERVVFSETDGWTAMVYSFPDSTDSRTFEAQELQDPSVVRDLLADEYIAYIWQRS